MKHALGSVRDDWSDSSWADRYHWLVVTTYNGNQAALARALGVVPQTVANILTGGDPSASTIRATLLKHRWLSVAWLVMGEGPPERSKDGVREARAFEAIAQYVDRIRAEAKR